MQWGSPLICDDICLLQFMYAYSLCRCSFLKASFWRKLIPGRATEGTVSEVMIILLCFFVIINSRTWYWLPISSVTAVIPAAWSRWFKIIGIASFLVWQKGLRTTFVFLGFKLLILVLDKISLWLVIWNNPFHYIYFWFLSDNCRDAWTLQYLTKVSSCVVALDAWDA